MRLQAIKNNCYSNFTSVSATADNNNLNSNEDKETNLNFNFGIQELSISHDFLTLKSDFTNSYNYAFNGDIMLRDRAPRSILSQGSRYLKPQKMEIWVFEDAADLFKHEHGVMSSSSDTFEDNSQFGDAKSNHFSSSSQSLK